MPLLAVTMYNVESVGVAVGASMLLLSKPVVGDHEKEVPLLEAFIVVGVPMQVKISAPAFMLGGVFTIIFMLSRVRQPSGLVTLT